MSQHPYEPQPGSVDDAAFWDLVAQSRASSDDGDERQAEALRAILGRLDAEAVARFHVRLAEASISLHTWMHATAAELVCGSLGDDLFTDFRSWLIAHGRDTYDRVLADPDSLADLPDLYDGCGAGEPFGAAAGEVYAAKTGREIWEDGFPILEPSTDLAGSELRDADAVRAVLPRLSALD